MAKWRRLNVRVRNFRAFNFRSLSKWRKIFNGENVPIYKSISMLFQYGTESDPRWGWLWLLDAHAAMQLSVPARIYSRRENIGKWSLSVYEGYL